MMFIFNRLRGTNGVWSKCIGLLLALVLMIVFHNTYVALAVGLGYIIGESFGWGLWVGTVSEQRDGAWHLHDEGEGRHNGIEWLASKIIQPTQETWVEYCRVALTIRGFYWAMPTLAPLYFVGFNPYLLITCIAFLSIGFPLAYDLGYYLRDKVSFDKFGLSFSGGWELGEGIVGIEQDLVLITLIGVGLWA